MSKGTVTSVTMSDYSMRMSRFGHVIDRRASARYSSGCAMVLTTRPPTAEGHYHMYDAKKHVVCSPASVPTLYPVHDPRPGTLPSLSLIGLPNQMGAARLSVRGSASSATYDDVWSKDRAKTVSMPATRVTIPLLDRSRAVVTVASPTGQVCGDP